MQTVALIDYGSGNLHSAERALRAAALRAKKTREIRVTYDPDTIARADRIVLPGVGHFADCKAGLSARSGLIEALNEAVLARGAPFFGICVGMQLMADWGLEDGRTAGLGWVAGEVTPLCPPPGFRVPHMGWNEVRPTQSHALFEGLAKDAHAYFVHSYAFRPQDAAHTAAVSDHGVEFTAVIARDNLFGTQFHPEKSQDTGLTLLGNFLKWKP